MSLSVALIRQRFRNDGGGERLLLRLLETLAANRAIEPHLICRSWQGAAFDGAIEICDPPYRGRIGREHSFAVAVQALLASRQFDLVQSHERIPGCAIYRAGDGVHAAWLERYSHTLGAAGRLWLRLSPFHAYQLRTERALFTHPKLRAVICNSEMVRSEIHARFPIDRAKLHLIRNGIDTDAFHPRLREYRAAYRARLGVDETVPLLLFVGSGFARKGLAPALRALAETGRAQLVVIGRDSHVHRYQRLARKLGIAGRVHFLGAVDDVRPWYGAGDGLLLPTLYDPFPNVALEAMACGLGVITSPGAGAAELITSGVNGYVGADRAALAAAIAAFELPDHARALGIAARRSAEPFTLVRMQSELTALYAELLDRQEAA